MNMSDIRITKLTYPNPDSIAHCYWGKRYRNTIWLGSSTQKKPELYEREIVDLLIHETIHLLLFDLRVSTSLDNVYDRVIHRIGEPLE